MQRALTEQMEDDPATGPLHIWTVTRALGGNEERAETLSTSLIDGASYPAG